MAPASYLRMLQRSPLHYAKLLEDHGGDIIRAGYELACVKRAATSHCHCGERMPTAREVWTAAQEIQVHTGSLTPVPSKHAIAGECRAAGLEVLE